MFEDLGGKEGFAKVEGFEDFDAIAPTLLQLLLNARPLPLKNGIVGRNKIAVLVAPLVQVKHRQQLGQGRVDPGGHGRKLGGEQVQRLLVVVGKILVAFHFAIAHQQHGDAIAPRLRCIEIRGLRLFFRC